MQNISYNIKIWHKDTCKYEDLGVFIEAPTRHEAVDTFRKTTKWIDKKNTYLVAVPPICR